MSEAAHIKSLSSVVLFEALLRRLTAKGLIDEADRRAIIDDAMAMLREIEGDHPGGPGAEYLRIFFNAPTINHTQP